MTDKVIVRTLPRDLKPGDEVYLMSGWYVVKEVRKRPQRRYQGEIVSPTRYLVWLEGVTGKAIVAPHSRVEQRVAADLEKLV